MYVGESLRKEAIPTHPPTSVRLHFFFFEWKQINVILFCVGEWNKTLRKKSTMTQDIT